MLNSLLKKGKFNCRTHPAVTHWAEYRSDCKTQTMKSSPLAGNLAQNLIISQAVQWSCCIAPDSQYPRPGLPPGAAHDFHWDSQWTRPHSTCRFASVDWSGTRSDCKLLPPEKSKYHLRKLKKSFNNLTLTTAVIWHRFEILNLVSN